jgi:hypothetical protein
MPVPARSGSHARGLPSFLLTTTFLLTALAMPAAARRCGDDVDGRGTRVACACGDVLVGSARLAAGDPLVQAPCPAGGLVVDIPAKGTHAATLELDGQIVSGSGRGVGIEVIAGGPHGLAIVGPGGVRGFDLGIVAREGALASITAVESSRNVHDGFRVGGRDYRLVDCRANENGRDGFVLQGEGYRADRCEAVGNGRDGFAVRGHPATVVAEDNTADANGRRAARTRGRARRAQEGR